MKKRVISAIVMVILLIPTLIIGNNVFAVAMGMIGILALKEFIDLRSKDKKIPDIVKLICFIDLLLLIFSEFDGYSIAFGLSYKGIAISFITILLPSLLCNENKYNTKEAFYLFGSVVFLGLIFNSVILIRNISLWRFLYLVIIVTVNDTFAYMIGSLIGRHKCFPKISPRKTLEGLIAGNLVSTGIGVIFYINTVGNVKMFKLVFLTLLLSIMGQLGDLIFSKIKRENNIKDFSNLIPGHGGVLDRIDSLTFVVLFYIILFGII